jgi:spermidine/putrescine transport system permease protein
VSRTPRALQLRRFPGFATIAWISLAFLYVPMAVVVLYAFNGGDHALVWDGFSTVWFARVLRDPDIVDATLVSLKLALIATVVSTAMAVGIALVLDRWRARSRGIAMALISAPLVIPEIVSGVATLGFIRLIGLPPGFTALVLAHVTFCIPFALLPLRARLSQLDPAYFEAGADLGATDWKLFRRITLPLLAPGIVSGALLAFIISLDDFIISSFLSAAGSTTLPIYLFGLIRKGVSPAVNAVATILLALSAAVVTSAFLMTQRRGDR